MQESSTIQSLNAKLTDCQKNGTRVCAASPKSTALFEYDHGLVNNVPK